MPQNLADKIILLVEDEALIAMNEASILEKHGFDVVTAHNAKKAIETAEKQTFDLILMDIDLGRGKMDGTAAAQAILDKQDIPVVFLSSHTEPEVVKKTEGITSYGYIVKNSGETVLLASIKMAFRLHDAHMELKNQKENLREALIKQEQTEEELERYFESSLDLLCIANTDGVFIRLNPEWEKVLGYPVSELEGCSFMDFVHEDDKAATLDAIGRLEDQEEVLSFVNRYRCRDGSYRWIEWRSKPMGLYIYAVARDITERKEHQEEIRIREERFQKTFNLIPDMISIHDPEMNILYSNWQGFAAVPEEKRRAGTKCYRTYRGFDHICPDCRAKTVLETKKAFQEEVKLPDGTWTDIRVIPILDQENNIEMFVEWVRIITKRKEAEIELDSQRSFLSAVLDSLEEAIIICDGEGRIVRFNEAARRVHGLPEKPIPPEQWAEYYDLYQVDGVTPLPMKDIPLYRALTGTNVANQELIVVRSDRDPCHFVCNGKAITAGGGNIIGAVVAMHDITSLKEAEKDLQISLEEKEFLMQELGHRVKNNLMMVSSLISLKDSALGGRADLTDIKRQVEAILLLHEKLDGMERVNNIDFGKYVEELVENLFSFSRKPVKLEIDITDILLPTKQAVPLGLIVNEIATNAVKHGLTDEEEANFSVSLREVPAAGEYILTLSNNGKPFPEGIDLENPSTLGLRLVSALVSQLNGTVELTRAPHPVFTIRFPMGKQE